MDDIMGPFSLPNDQEELKLSLIKAKLEELKQENQNLMLLIARITKDYEALIVRVCQAKQSTHKRSFPNDSRVNDDDDLNQLVSLTLGRTSSSLHKQEEHNNEEKLIGTNLCQTSREGEQKWRNDHGLDLGLDCKFVRRQAEDQLLSSENLGMDKEKMIKENWNEAKHKEKKTKFEGGKEVNMVGRRKDEEEAKDAKVKKTRVSIKARCPAPMINDGCHWRKYGQKTAKGNPCPRAYYRCTISPSCPVKKQVQRSAEDKSILITTYEGTHNHSLPPAAIPMAFATSAATSHLLSGPITSSGPQDHLSSLNINPNIYTTIDNPTWSSSYSPYYLHPTITIDLTSIDTSSASHSNPNIVELGFPGHERSIPFNLNQHFMQKDENGISINDGEKITNPNHEILATALASNPRFKSVLAHAIGSHIANNRNDQHFKQKDENGISISDGEKINNPNHEILAAALASNPRFESVLADAIASHIANNCSGGEP